MAGAAATAPAAAGVARVRRRLLLTCVAGALLAGATGGSGGAPGGHGGAVGGSGGAPGRHGGAVGGHGGAPGWSPATRDRPPTAVTGGFGEPTCQLCHSEAAVNSGPGRLLLDGVPHAYEPGAAYPITLTVVHGGARVFGFELAARHEGGGQAGSLAPAAGSEERVGITPEAGISYAHHLRPGTMPLAPDTARWLLVWTAPDAGGTVSFHAAANAANDDDSPLGDYVYTATAVSRLR